MQYEFGSRVCLFFLEGLAIRSWEHVLFSPNLIIMSLNFYQSSLNMSANYCVAHRLSLCRFIDISRNQKLHLWKSDSAEISFSSLVSAICSCGSDRLTKGTPLLDKRSGNIIAVWRAHDGHITKVTAPIVLYHRCYKNLVSFDIFWSVFSFPFMLTAGSTRWPLNCIKFPGQVSSSLGHQRVLFS
jgi:hypothetical protein